MGAKKREYLRNLYRDGYLYTREIIQAYDHDFTSLADGVVIPHSIYDVQRNTAAIHLDTSRDMTTVFDGTRPKWSDTVIPESGPV